RWPCIARTVMVNPHSGTTTFSPTLRLKTSLKFSDPWNPSGGFQRAPNTTFLHFLCRALSALPFGTADLAWAWEGPPGLRGVRSAGRSSEKCPVPHRLAEGEQLRSGPASAVATRPGATGGAHRLSAAARSSQSAREERVHHPVPAGRATPGNRFTPPAGSR